MDAEMRNCINVWSENLKRIDQLEDFGTLCPDVLLVY